jgi:CRP-like cAMP-binding protein
MITLEKLLLLKSLTLFKETPDDLLMQVVTSVVKEQRVDAGEQIIEKGDSGTSMYVLVSGRVKVHDQELVITELGEREIFGELSALSLQPRVASVSAITDCFLLKISSAGLYELMSFDIGLAKGIIQALCERARTMSIQMQALLHKSPN